MKIYFILVLILLNTISFSHGKDDDLELATKIKDLLNQKDIDFRKHDWAKLARQTQLNLYFNDFTWWFAALDSIKNNKEFSKTCPQYFYREDNNPMKEYLTKYIRKYCVDIFLSNKKVLTQDDLNFILDNHTYFLSNLKFLKSFKHFYNEIKDSYFQEVFQNIFKIYIQDHFSNELLSTITDESFKQTLLAQRQYDKTLLKIANSEKVKLKRLFKNLKKNKNALNSYSVNYKLLQFHQYREAVYRIVHFFIRNKEKEKSLLILNNIMSNENVDSELAFLFLWWGVRFNEEKHVLNNFELIEEFEKDPKTLFWYAQNLQNSEQIEKAKEIYIKIIQKFTVNYYAIMANKKLKQMNPKTDILKQHVLKNKNSHETYTLKPEILTKLDRLEFWMKLKARSILEMDIRSIQSRPNSELYQERQAAKHNDKHQINLLIGEKLHENEFSLMAFRFFFELFNTQDATLSDLKGLHPIKQLNYINQYNTTLDPMVILSLIKQESGFNSRAKSHVGASGLMQIMPATARRLSGKRRNDLLNVEYNIKLGTKYLDLLNTRWNGNLVFVLSSYNAGEARVQEWIKNYFNGDDLIGNIEAIPFLETNNYVKLIFRNLYFYKMTQNLNAFDNEKPNYIYDVYLGF